MKKIWTLLMLLNVTSVAVGQTDYDGIMMAKKNLCIGPLYGYNSWADYWEGSLKRNNENLGIVSTNTVSIMGNYGISKTLNILFNVPYISTKASAGQMMGLSGMQDVSLWLKCEAYNKKWGSGVFSVYTIAGFSTPMQNYVKDFLPLSIGLGSTNGIIRALVDYEWDKWFATAGYTYTYRGNISLDRTAYFTTQMHYTNVVAMPNVSSLNLRCGYRHNDNIAEVFIEDIKTLGGFDITLNNMPFPSNRMDATRVGGAFKYNINWIDGLSLVGNISTTITGRNVGTSTGFGGGFFYIVDFNSKTKKS